MVLCLNQEDERYTRTCLDEEEYRMGPTFRSRDAGGQIGGFVLRVRIESDNVRVRFVTIREAGHMTPACATIKALHTLHAMFEDREIAPKCPVL